MEPSASSHGGVLPDDVLRQIFLRLPARAVCRFRAACKSWRALASEPDLLRAHARLRAASSSPVVLSWSIANQDVTSDLLLTVDDDAASLSHGGRPPCRTVLPGLWSPGAEVSSWDGILCVELATRLYALVNPLSGARTVVAAPALRDGERRRSDTRGYIAGAYSHPVTGIFHLLHCSCSSQDADAHAPLDIRFRLLRVDGASASAWREIPMSDDPDTATLQTVAGHNLCASSATVHGRLHWRDMLRGQEELLVFDTVEEEFGAMPLPQELVDGDGDAVTVQQTVTTVSGKLCLLGGLVERRTGAGRVEVWVLEDYLALEWRLRQSLCLGGTPLHTVNPSRYLGNVGLITNGDRVEKMVFCNGSRKEVYDFQRELLSTAKLGRGVGIAIHTDSPAPQDVVFGAASTQGVGRPLYSHPNPNNVVGRK
ncbi:unnamed protein product [Urochloa humidicola]